MSSGIGGLEKLEYSISKCSSFSVNYHPSNIRIDKPEDQSSRWSSETNSTPQFIILKLSKFAIVHTITFGKYEKAHVCNLKKFKVYGGLDEDSMVELLEGGLRNDNRPESFMLRYKAGGKQFACRYIKIVPIQSWGSTFNFTVWYIEMIGNTKWDEVSEAIEWLDKYRKNETVRFCLKFLRQMNYNDAFKSLCKESSVHLEHAAMSELFNTINSGNYEETEKFIDDAVENGMMNNYISRLDYKAMWELIIPNKPRPGMRGGHQMCLDSYSESIYLFGGWNGQKDLSDLWAYDIPTSSWSLLSADTFADGGPSARSCHKMCIDSERRQIFVLGRYLDVHCRNAATLKSDFYVYDIENREWTKITDDTSAMGGPRLIFDHQMCMDISTRTIYVFGGRILQPVPAMSGEVPPTHTEAIYSGLYSYHVSTNTWIQITDENDSLMRSRVGHSMLYHPIYRKLYVFAGQKNKDYLNDFFSYNIDTGGVEYLCEGCSRDCNNLPGAGFTQRATIDPDLNEIYVLSGLSKDKDKRDDNVQNSFWVYYILQNKWTCIYKSETSNAQFWNKMFNIEPCPRYAHQLVYNNNEKVHYLFGGNPGMTCLPKLRLDDFWRLQLTRPTHPQLRRLCKILIRKCRFQELAYGDTTEAMYYLQNELGEVIDHSNKEECSQLTKMAICLFDDTFSKPQCAISLYQEITRLRARYTKNLSPDKINVSTFKGEGELSSLELDEIILTDLLELPSWVRLTSAWCNKVSFRIQWTKLKSVPISIFLDEVNVEIETCEELRSLSAQQGLSTYSAPTKYNFINKVIDGMTISVNVVSITFKTPAFTASVQIMRIFVESKTPTWKKGELNKTRLKDSSRGQILIFKGLEWQTLRLEASSTKDIDLPPLRLLTNKATCKLTIKKRLSDCFVLGCKLLLRLDDLLWVLTDSQLKAVLHFVESLSGLVQKADETTRIKKAARKLEMLPEYHAQVSQQARSTETSSTKEQIFARFDVIETSYHFIAQKIVLHLSDDPGAGRSFHPSLQNGSAVCLKICALQVDYYPYHLASADRNHWGRYNPDSSPHVQWLSAAQNAFKMSLLQLIDSSNKKNVGSDHCTEEDNPPSDQSYESSPSNNLVKKYVISNLAKVMTSCIVLRVEDFIMYRVTTLNKQTPKEFIKGDRHSFPSEVTLHAEFTYYYYPGDVAFPLPPPKFYVQINPVIVNFDLLTVLWLNSFALNLHQPLLSSKQEGSINLNYIDVKIETIMPRLIFECSNETQCGQRDRPKSLQFQVSRALLSNVRSADFCSRTDLAKCINAAQHGSLFYGCEFPVKENDQVVITYKFIDHINCKDNIRSMVESLPTGSVAELVNSLSKTLLWTEARDVWCINLEPVWGDFYGARGVAHNRPVAFLDAFPLKIWLHTDQPKNDIHALAYISNLVSIQINHYQLLFLLRLADELTELSTILEMDAERIKNEKSSIVVVGAVIPQVEITLVMPSQTPGKESSGADLESVIPDTSSLADDIVTNPSIQWNSVLTTNLQDGAVYKKENIVYPASPPSDQISFELASPTKLDSPKTNLNSLMGLSSMKKGLTNFSKMIDSALKPIPDDAISDSISIRSDGSSDSDNSVMIRLSQADDMFNMDGNDGLSEGVDIGSEAFEEDNNSGTTMSITTASESHSNASSYKRRDLISVATFKLGQVEFIQQSQGLESVMKVQISNITIEDCSAIPWDEFQSKFSTRSRGWTEVCEQPADRPRIRLRKEHSVTTGDLKASNLKISSWFNDLVTIHLSNINLAMNTSTISSVAEFAVDDVSSPPLPVEIHVENLEFTIVDDRPTAQGGGTPANINISKLCVHKNKDGLIIIEPPTPGAVSTPISQEVIDLKAENEQLRRRLIALERLNEENHRLRKSEEETQILRTCLSEAQETLNSLLLEKQGLLVIIKNLQLSKGDGKQQSSGKR